VNGLRSRHRTPSFSAREIGNISNSAVENAWPPENQGDFEEYSVQIQDVTLEYHAKTEK
jgi:hypothetical protein